MHPGPLSDGQFYSPPESVGGGTRLEVTATSDRTQSYPRPQLALLTVKEDFALEPLHVLFSYTERLFSLFTMYTA
ncbi:hypothetical protein DPEC_G00058110 [Dallia pectoralis]|uniref:Uncharacterized protein n=1 Tax=Dallia pectoralis TaxID=75939 RepID=A0ACC2H629_DALPE|nr:hypothetical protein DPEC_G00058110 [Dallia pectoralis]